MRKMLLHGISLSLLCACMLVPAIHAKGEGYQELTSPYVTKIEIVHPADRIEYDLGDVFDPSGLVLQATYSDGSVANVSDFTYKDSPLKLRDKKIAIHYSGFSVDFAISVEDPNADPATVRLLQFTGTFVLRMDLFKDQHFRIYFEGFDGSQSCGSWSWQDGKLTLKHNDQGLLPDYHNKVEVIEQDETGTLSYSFFHEKTGYQMISADATAWVSAFGDKEFPMPDSAE